jgi:hypothetical protein
MDLFSLAQALPTDEQLGDSFEKGSINSKKKHLCSILFCYILFYEIDTR